MRPAGTDGHGESDWKEEVKSALRRHESWWK